MNKYSIHLFYCLVIINMLKLEQDRRMKMKKKIFGIIVLILAIILTPKVFAEEMNEAFKLVLNEEGKLIIDSIPPKDYEEAIYIIEERTFYDNEYNPKYDFEKYGELSINLDTCDEKYTKCTMYLREYMGTNIIEQHDVEIVYNYDKEILTKLNNLISNFPKNIENFEITDLELINYWMNIKDEEDDHLDNYSGQLKSYLNNANIEFYVSNRAGDDSPFYNLRKGIATISYKGTIYYIDTFLGTKAENVIYVEDDTTDVLARAQERINTYLGSSDLAKIKLGGKISDWVEEYKKEIEEEWKLYYQQQYSMYKTSFDSCVEVNGEDSDFCKYIIPEYMKTFENYIDYSGYSFEGYEVFKFLEESGETNYYTTEINGIKHNFLIIKNTKNL